MSESVELMKQQIREWKAECGKLHEEKVLLMATCALLQTEISKMRAEARKDGSDGSTAGSKPV